MGREGGGAGQELGDVRAAVEALFNFFIRCSTKKTGSGSAYTTCPEEVTATTTTTSAGQGGIEWQGRYRSAMSEVVGEGDKRGQSRGEWQFGLSSFV